MSTKRKSVTKTPAARHRWLTATKMSRSIGRSSDSCRLWAVDSKLERREVRGFRLTVEYRCPPDWKALMGETVGRRDASFPVVEKDLIPGTWMTTVEMAEALDLPMSRLQPRVSEAGLEAKKDHRRDGTIGRPARVYLIPEDWVERLRLVRKPKPKSKRKKALPPLQPQLDLVPPQAPPPQPLPALVVPTLETFQSKEPAKTTDEIAFERAVLDRANANVLYRSYKQYLETFDRPERYRIEQSVNEAARQLNRERFAQAA